jgi:hypothetical protein
VLWKASATREATFCNATNPSRGYEQNLLSPAQPADGELSAIYSGIAAATSCAEARTVRSTQQGPTGYSEQRYDQVSRWLFHPLQAIVVVGLALAAVVVLVIALLEERQRVAPQSLCRL